MATTALEASAIWRYVRQTIRFARPVRLVLPMVVLCVLSASAETIRSKSDLRLWETVADRSAPLSWPWEDGADAATIVFSNRVSHAVSSITVPRAANEMRGTCGQPVPSAGEDVVDVALTQTAAGNAIARELATLAYVAGAGGGPITVRAKDKGEWKRFLSPRVFAVDPAWRGLAGDSGYDIAWPKYIGMRILFR